MFKKRYLKQKFLLKVIIKLRNIYEQSLFFIGNCFKLLQLKTLHNTDTVCIKILPLVQQRKFVKVKLNLVP